MRRSRSRDAIPSTTQDPFGASLLQRTGITQAVQISSQVGAIEGALHMEDPKHKQLLGVIAESEPKVLQTMQQMRSQNQADLSSVAPEIKRVNDFVLASEMKEACKQAGQRMNVNLDDFYLYFVTKIAKQHNFHTVDANQFLKMLIDWSISEALHASKDANNLRAMLPIHSTGDVYFYSPNLEAVYYDEGRNKPARGKAVKQEVKPDVNTANNPLEFALTEIFNYYTRRYAERHKDFENQHEMLYRLGMKGYVAFVKDMQIPVNKERVIEVWKKTSINQQALLFEEFKSSLTRLGQGSIAFIKESKLKTVAQIKQAIQHLKSAKPTAETDLVTGRKGEVVLKLPIHYLPWQGKSEQELQAEIETLMNDVKAMKLLSDEQMHDIITAQYIQYMSPSKYRSRMPGYEETFQLINVNTKMAKKILQVRATNADTASIGGASGITSMLSRGRNNPKIMNFKQQQDSVTRLFNQPHLTAGDQFESAAETEKRQKLQEYYQRRRQERFEQASDNQSNFSLPPKFAREKEQEYSVNDSVELGTKPKNVRNVSTNYSKPHLLKAQNLQKLNKITLDDIQSMHYSALNAGQAKEDQFDPSTLIDFGSSDQENEDELLKRFKKSPSPVFRSPATLISQQQKPNFDQQLKEQVNEILMPQAYGHNRRAGPQRQFSNITAVQFSEDKPQNILNLESLETEPQMASPQANRVQSSYKPSDLPPHQAKLPKSQRKSLAQPVMQTLSRDPSEKITQAKPHSKLDLNMKLEQLNFRDINVSEEKLKMLKRADQIEDNQTRKNAQKMETFLKMQDFSNKKRKL